MKRIALSCLLLSACVTTKESNRRVDVERQKQQDQCSTIQEDLIRHFSTRIDEAHAKWVVMFCLRDEQMAKKIARLEGKRPIYYQGCNAIRGAFEK